MYRTQTDSFIRTFSDYGDSAKISKAKRMLRKTNYNLMVVEKDYEIYGVIKSQTNPNLLYAVTLDSKGNYFCGTQNLRRCGGLRNGPCKHMYLLALVLINSGSDYDKISMLFRNIVNRNTTVGVSEKEQMENIFIDYANRTSSEYLEATSSTDEIEWREIDTDPEDYI